MYFISYCLLISLFGNSLGHISSRSCSCNSSSHSTSTQYLWCNPTSYKHGTCNGFVLGFIGNKTLCHDYCKTISCIFSNGLQKYYYQPPVGYMPAQCDCYGKVCCSDLISSGCIPEKSQCNLGFDYTC